MANYKVEWKRPALRELEKLPHQAVSRIVVAVGKLSADPYPPGARKLVGSDRNYRIRVGDYRVIYEVLDDVLVVSIIRVRHRKDVYR